MRVIIKIEVREITFGHAVITWNFFLIFYCCKIASFGLLKVRFEGKKQKDMADDGNIFCMQIYRSALFGKFLLHQACLEEEPKDIRFIKIVGSFLDIAAYHPGLWIWACMAKIFKSINFKTFLTKNQNYTGISAGLLYKIVFQTHI